MRYVIVETYHESSKCWQSFKYNSMFKIFGPKICTFINISFESAENCVNELKKIISVKDTKPIILYILNDKFEKE